MVPVCSLLIDNDIDKGLCVNSRNLSECSDA